MLLLVNCISKSNLSDLVLWPGEGLTFIICPSPSPYLSSPPVPSPPLPRLASLCPSLGGEIQPDGSFMCSCNTLCEICWEGSKREHKSFAFKSSQAVATGESQENVFMSRAAKPGHAKGQNKIRDFCYAGRQAPSERTDRTFKGGTGNTMSKFPAGVFRIGTRTTVTRGAKSSCEN